MNTTSNLLNGIVSAAMAGDIETSNNLKNLQMGLDRLAGKIPADNRMNNHSEMYNYQQHQMVADKCIENPAQRNLNNKEFTIAGWCEACKYWWNSISQVPAYINQTCPGLDIKGYSITLEDYTALDSPLPNPYLFMVTLNGPAGQLIDKSIFDGRIYAPSDCSTSVLMSIGDFVISKIKWYRSEPLGGMVSNTQILNGEVKPEDIKALSQKMDNVIQQANAAAQQQSQPAPTEENKPENTTTVLAPVLLPLPMEEVPTSMINDTGAGFSTPSTTPVVDINESDITIIDPPARVINNSNRNPDIDVIEEKLKKFLNEESINNPGIESMLIEAITEVLDLINNPDERHATVEAMIFRICNRKIVVYSNERRIVSFNLF